MAEIKSLSSISEKWARVTPQRQDDYKTGVANPKRDWAEETKASKENWKAGVDAAHNKDLFVKGIEAAGTGKWKEKTLKKGPARFAEGVYIAQPDYEKGFAPYREAIASAELGPRYPKRDPRNLNRVKSIVDALIAKKLGG
jgi:hypothetical protein